MIEQILGFIAGLAGVAALGQYVWTRWRHKPEVRKEMAESDYSSPGISEFRTGVTRDGRAWSKPHRNCNVTHPINLSMTCELDPSHVGVHERRGVRWYGSVVFPRPGRPDDDKPVLINPYIPPPKKVYR